MSLLSILNAFAASSSYSIKVISLSVETTSIIEIFSHAKRQYIIGLELGNLRLKVEGTFFS